MEIIQFKDRVIDEEGNVVYFTNALMEMLYMGESPEEILFPNNDQDINRFNQLSYENYDDVFYKLPERIKTTYERKNTWFYPVEYDSIDLREYFLSKVSTNIEIERVEEELKRFSEKNLEKFLRFCIFLSDKIKENDWCVGCGRGSSCASYLLYLLEIHLINSIEYNLDYKEFLK